MIWRFCCARCLACADEHFGRAHGRPDLGADSVAAGRIALIVGFVAVIGFMIVSYSLFGVFANAALIANLVLIMAVLSGLQATLTLPGIAGIG